MQMKNYFNLKKSKLLLLTLLTLLVVGARPAWAQKAMPYSYGFEDNDLAADGWTTQNPSGSAFGINSSFRKTGSYGFCFSSTNDGGESTPQYLISPELNASGEIELTFEYRGHDPRYSENFKVGYSTTNTDIASFTFGDKYSIESTSWTTFKGSFPAGTKYIAVYYYTDSYLHLYVDDFSFAYMEPTDVAAALTMGDGTVAALSWTENGTATQWQICLNDDEENLITATTNPYTLTGLTPETTYTAKVRAVVGEGWSKWSDAVSFTPSNACSVTINDGTTTNQYVPIYGYYVDDITKSQFVIPASSLQDMQWGNITKMTFYSEESSINWGNAQFEVYMTEQNGTTLSSMTDYGAMTKVKNAGSLSVSDGKMVVTLDEPYLYGGEDLVIGFLQTVTGTYVRSPWYGVTANGASFGGYGSSVSQQDFLPKTTFDYEPGELPYVNVTGVTLAQTEGVLKVGGTLTLTPTIAPDDATDKRVTWTTSDAAVATVDGNGVVTAQGLGTATITATATNGTADTSDDLTATFTVNVYPWAGSGTADDPFQIQNVDDWNTLAANVTGGETYSGIYFKMTDDIIGVTTRTGKNSVNPFSGTFDGQGHTMNLNIYTTNTTNTDGSTSAPFGYISGATIKNLHITGSETIAYMRAASIAGFAENSTITNCWSEVALTSGYGKDIDCGAFVATVIANSSLTLNGCLFTGTITYTNADGYEGGGMVGYTRSGGTATLNDCLFAPASFTVTKYYGHYMFVGGKKRGMLNNCYYNDVAAATSLVKEGKQAFSIVKGDDVSSLAISGEGTEYSVSGITAYATGIKYNDVYYAGSGEAVGLTLSHADREGYTFSTYAVTGGGTLADATTDTPTLTMSEADAVVSAMWLLPTDETGAYLISSAGDWNSFCYDVNNGNAYSGKTVKLTQDISEAVNTTAGTSEALSFQGTFDGQAHTLNVNITDNSNSPAPFRYIKNATIRNLVVTGNITSSQKHVAGLAKATYGDILIENCNVAATISGARYMGGFIGHSQDAQVTINGCVFSGTLSPTGSDYTGGFICWGEGVTGNTMAVTNSLFCGTLAGSGSSKFHPIGFNYTPANPTRVFTNTYYTIAAKNINEDTDEKSFVNGLDAESKGKQAYALATAPANLGDLVQDFGVMTAYENGILCGDIYYVAPADITLNETEAGEVTAVDGYFSNVTLTRTLQAGSYNTFAAPFDISVSELSAKGITTVKELQSSTFADGVLTLIFADAESIEVGKPYLVKVSENVVNPTFSGVTVSSAATTKETTAVDFIPTLGATAITANAQNILFLSAGNKLYKPAAADSQQMKGFRAYFLLKGDAAAARTFRMDFGDGEVQGISEIEDGKLKMGNGGYDLQGRRMESSILNSQSSTLKKGVYIVNGKKTVIK